MSSTVIGTYQTLTEFCHIMTSHVHTHSMVLLFTVSLNYTFSFLFTAPIQSTSLLPSSPAPVSLMSRTGPCSTKCMSTYTIGFSCVICREHCPPAHSKHVPAPKLIPSQFYYNNNGYLIQNRVNK